MVLRALAEVVLALVIAHIIQEKVVMVASGVVVVAQGKVLEDLVAAVASEVGVVVLV